MYKVKTYFGLFLMFLCSISKASGEYFTLINGYKIVKSNFTWPIHLLNTNSSLSDIPDFEATVKDLILPNEELLNATWKFQLSFSKAEQPFGIQLKARYQRAGPPVKCDESYGTKYISGEDGWTDPWKFILLSVKLSSESTDQTVNLGSYVSALPHYQSFTIVNPSNNVCRKLRENHFDLYNLQNSLNTLCYSDSEGGDITTVNLNFKIQFISQIDNADTINKYNELVGLELTQDTETDS